MKRLVICCDGTWQRLYGGSLTNVALTARSVASRDAKGNLQIVYYSAGVGASVDGASLWQGMTGDDLDDHLFADARGLLQRRLRAAELLQRAREDHVLERAAREFAEITLGVALHD